MPRQPHFWHIKWAKSICGSRTRNANELQWQLCLLLQCTSQAARRQTDRLLMISGEREKCARMQGNFMLQHITCHSGQTLIASVVHTSAKNCEDTNSSCLRVFGGGAVVIRFAKFLKLVRIAANEMNYCIYNFWLHTTKIIKCERTRCGALTDRRLLRLGT